MSCIFDITWSTQIEYTDEKKGEIPKEEGVYEIQGYVANRNEYTRRYVGRTDDLQRRFGEHLLNNEPNEKLKKFLNEKKAYFRYTKTENESMSKDIENGLYDIYRHTCNDPEKPPAGSGNCQKISINESNP